MGAGRMRFMRGPSFTYASETNNSSTSTSSFLFRAFEIADWRTFSTVGAIRLLVVRRVVIAEPAFWPRMRSTTSLAFCAETRIYLASALASMLVTSPLGRLSRFLGRRFHRMAFEGAGGGKLAQLVPYHIFGYV